MGSERDTNVKSPPSAVRKLAVKVPLNISSTLPGARVHVTVTPLRISSGASDVSSSS